MHVKAIVGSQGAHGCGQACRVDTGSGGLGWAGLLGPSMLDWGLNCSFRFGKRFGATPSGITLGGARGTIDDARKELGSAICITTPYTPEQSLWPQNGLMMNPYSVLETDL